jgi:hypothetical protein
MWSAPLVGPLENGALVVPVAINGKGPYLFMIDPDSPVSSVDSALVSELDLYVTAGEKIEDETDTRRQVGLAEVRTIKVGDLTVKNRPVRIHTTGTFWFGGRRIRGLLGRDVLADSLVLQVDRDRGMLFLATQGHLDPPVNAVALKGRHYFKRFIVKAKLNRDHNLSLHLDLGAPWTMLWESKMSKMKLPRVRIRATLLDELGTARQVESGAMTQRLDVSGATADGLLVLPFGDKRMRERDFDGALGQNFLSQFNITLNWHKKSAWLKPRVVDLGEMAAPRMKRWGASFAKCKTPACVTVSISGGVTGAPAADAAGKPAPIEEAPRPPPPPPVPAPASLVFQREAWTRDLTYDVVVEALNDDGTPIGLPLLRVTFPIGAETVAATDGIAPYQGVASFRAVDLSPFPRECESGGAGMKCVWQIPRIR